MPIKFRCMHCRGLMAISTRKAGSIVDCPTCGEKTLVPNADVLEGDSAGATLNAPANAGVAVETVVVPPAQHESPHEEELFKSAPHELGTVLIQEHDTKTDERDEPDAEPFIPSDVDDDDAEPMKITRHKIGDEEMDLTPMVDVTFQLLIFFMVSASFSLQKTIEVPTPDPDQKGATQQVQTMDDLQGTSIVVRIDASSGIMIDDEPLADSRQLSDALRDKMRREQKTELLITAHPQSLHRMVIAVIDAANEIGVQKIRMSSQKKMD